MEPMINRLRHGLPRRRRATNFALAALLATVPLAACDNLLEVQDPDVVRPDQLEGADAIPTRVAGAILDFQIAFNGNFNNSTVVAQGMFSDEYVNSETFSDRIEVDRRNIDRTDNQIVLNVFSGLHVARVSALSAAATIEEFDPGNADLAYMRSLQGYAEILLGETFCSGVPDSELDGNQIVYGEPRTTQKVFEDAVAAFDEALAADASFDMAKVGKARALLDLGQFASAANAVSTVPTGFAMDVIHSSTTPSQENGLWNLSTNGRVSVANGDGGNGVNYRSLDDPRVPWEDTGDTGFDSQTHLYLQLVSPKIDSPVPLATGIEARLIEAEAALEAGDRGQFFSIHNAIRSRVGLGALTDTGQNVATLEDMHFRERALWLYSTAHRVGDLRRLVRQYGRPSNTVFPTGAYLKGGAFGTDVNFPIPIEEDNNPNTGNLPQGCIDRNA
jgi:SusD family